MREESAAWDHARIVLRTVLLVLAVGLALWLAYALQGICFLLLFSVFFAYLLAPVVEGVHRILPQAGRSTAVLLVFGAITLVAGTTLYAFLPRLGVQLEELLASAPQYVAQLKGALPNTASIRARLPEPLSEMVGDAMAQAAAHSHAKLEAAVVTAVGSLRFLPWLFLIPLIAFFLLKDAHAFRRSALQMLPQGRARWRGQDFFEEVNRTLASYIRAQLLACAFIGVVCSIAFAIIGLPYALVVGAFAAFAEFIPLAGPLAAAIVACVAAALGTNEPILLPTVVFLGVLRAVHDYAVYPRLIGRGINMHPLAVILAILCGSQLLGFVGLFLSIPMTAVFSVGYRHFKRGVGHEGLLAELLGPADDVISSPAIASTPPPLASAQLSGLRIVVVDNEPDALALLAMTLERAGATVAAATSAADAYSLVIAARPHVLISDIGMPHEDGFDLVRHVRALEDPALRSLPTIALTGYATPEDRSRAFGAGFTAHVAKPVDPSELMRVIRDVARRETQSFVSPELHALAG